MSSTATIRWILSAHLSVLATVAGACLLPLSAATAATAPTAPVATPVATPSTVSDADAAARHAKRTVCLKQAKDKKLVGAARNSFVKDCVAGH